MGWPAREYVYKGKPDGPPREPPPQRAKVLAFIKAEIGAGKGFPAKQQIAQHMGWKTRTSVNDVLSALVGDRCLTRKIVGATHVYSLAESQQ